MHLGQSATDAATQQMIDLQLPGLPVGYEPATGAPTYVAPAPTGVTADAAPAVASTSSPTDWNAIGLALNNLVTGGVTAYQAIQLQKMQADLIRQGRPPLSPYQMSLLAPQIGVGLAPSTQNMVMMLALGGGALLLLTSVMKSRRGR